MTGFKLVCKGKVFQCKEGESVLDALALKPEQMVRIGCKGGGCGVCRIRIISGQYSRGKMSKNHISDKDIESGISLACKTFAKGDVEFISLANSTSKPMTKVIGNLGDL